jgi:hypothetical protein
MNANKDYKDKGYFAQIEELFDCLMQKHPETYFSAPISGRYFSIKHTGDNEVNCNDKGCEKDRSMVLRIFDFFTNLNFMFSLNRWLLDLYYNNEDARKAMLTDGILIRFIVPEHASNSEKKYPGKVLDWYPKSMVDKWTINEFNSTKVSINDFFKRISTMKDKPEGSIEGCCDDPEGLGFCWGFWGGCEMSIPDFVTTRLDATLHMCRLEITPRSGGSNHTQTAEDRSKQLVIVEDPNAIFITAIGEWEAFYGAKAATPKKISEYDIISIGKSRLHYHDMNAFEISIGDYADNDYCLVLPILNPSYDMLTTAYLYEGTTPIEKLGPGDIEIARLNSKIIATTCC